MSYIPGTKLSHTFAEEKATVLTGGYVMLTKGKYVGQRMLLRDWIILADGETIDEDYIPLELPMTHEIGTSILWRKNEHEWRVAVQGEHDVLQLKNIYMEDGARVEGELERFPTMDAWRADLEGGEFIENPPLHDPVGTVWTKNSGGIVYHAMQKRHCVVELKQVRGNHTIYCDTQYATYADWIRCIDADELDRATDEEGWRQHLADQAAEPERSTAIPPLPRSRVSSIDMTDWTEKEIDEYRHYDNQRYEDTGPDCNFCHPQSGCDGDHSAENGEQRIRKPAAPIFVEQPLKKPATITEEQARANLAHAGQMWYRAMASETPRVEVSDWKRW
jgi:hypothetical protein